MVLQALPREGHPSESERPIPLAFCNDSAQTLFHKGLEGGLLLGREPTGLIEEAVGNLYGCLHSADNFPPYGRLSRAKSEDPPLSLASHTQKEGQPSVFRDNDLSEEFREFRLQRT